MSAQDGTEDDVGSVGEEAAKLFGALSDWAQGAGEHVDTGSAECSWCPVCRTVHVIRGASPEVREHLAVAASSLMQAAAGILAAASRTAEPGRPGVERIDLSDEAEDWPEETP